MSIFIDQSRQCCDPFRVLGKVWKTHSHGLSKISPTLLATISNLFPTVMVDTTQYLCVQCRFFVIKVKKEHTEAEVKTDNLLQDSHADEDYVPMYLDDEEADDLSHSMDEKHEYDSVKIEHKNNSKKPKLANSTTIPSNRNSKLKSSTVFVALHLGAGEHSWTKHDSYKSLCKKACLEAETILNQGGSAGEAVATMTMILEDSGIVNAGKGSNLTINKTVECDAGFMNGNGFFGGIGASPGIKNPILVAKRIADLHEQEPLMRCGIVPPTFLTGEGAKLWASTQGIPTCDNSTQASKKATKTYEKYMDKLNRANESINNEVNDTVGAIALDKYGNVASSVSSGGNWLKQSGRVGHAPMFGCGCWASNLAGSNPAVAASCSGGGEMLSKVSLPMEVARLVNNESNASLVQAVSATIQEKFLDSVILKNHKEIKNVGLIALLWEGRRGEFVWGHTAKDFVIAYTGSSFKSIKMHFSTLSPDMKLGQTIKADGVFF